MFFSRIQMHGVCILSIIPCRKEPSSKSELVTQLLFGELITVKDRKDDWSLIQHHNDGYECWINAQQYHHISESQHHDISEIETPLCSGLTGVIESKSDHSIFPVAMGSSLPGFITKSFMLGDKIFSFTGENYYPDKPLRTTLIQFASKYLNSPYLWGGRSPFGIDCSGLAQAVYKFCGIQLPRDAWQQSEKGTTLSFIEEAEEGDLAFFDNKDGKITHVGIILGNNRILHSSGNVRIDKLDHEGIYNEQQKKYTHHLRVIKRII